MVLFYYMESAKNACVDCGAAQVSHANEYWMAASQVVLSPVYGALDALTQGVYRIFPTRLVERHVPAIFRLLERLHLGKNYIWYDERNSHRTTVMWDEAKKRGITMVEFRIFNHPSELYYASFGKKCQIFDGLPRPRGHKADSLQWMDDKDLMRKRFQKEGLLVSKGGCVRTLDEALTLFRTLDKPVITKPNLGSRSRHTHVGIMTEADITRAFLSSKQLSPWVVIEEEQVGQVHRGTLIDGKLVAVMRREPPFVIGNGTSTIQSLIETENERPERHGEIFHTISLDDELKTFIAKQGFTLETVLPEGQKIYVHPKVGRGSGGATSDVTNETHPKIKAMLEKVAVVLKDPLIGVDFIVSDVTKSLSEQPKSAIIECNSLPFIDIHHYPLNGPVRNVAGAVWDLIFSQSS